MVSGNRFAGFTFSIGYFSLSDKGLRLNFFLMEGKKCLDSGGRKVIKLGGSGLQWLKVEEIS